MVPRAFVHVGRHAAIAALTPLTRTDLPDEPTVVLRRTLLAAAEQLEAAQLTLPRAAGPGAGRSGAGGERAGGAAPAGHRQAWG
ncbi:hypothetical protein [Nonomuraea turkmeniaca]|uniref:hypothetical protein n=1 Tax=Nonomuraea turkmeniaca TaxID=103838 RepID=UPI0014775A3D|nr:hypothetical protein [Nonomuraea turkmeniaca]